MCRNEWVGNVIEWTCENAAVRHSLDRKKFRLDTGHVTLVLETAAVETEGPDCRAKTNLKLKTITNNEISKIHSEKKLSILVKNTGRSFRKYRFKNDENWNLRFKQSLKAGMEIIGGRIDKKYRFSIFYQLFQKIPHFIECSIKTIHLFDNSSNNTGT